MFKKITIVIVCIFALIGFFLVAGYFAVRLGLTNDKGIIDTQREAFFGNSIPSSLSPAVAQDWMDTEEWQILETAIRRDVPAIQRAAADSGVPARLIVANLVAEQLRLFFTEREFYKQFFYPLKILGSQTQFSWGVMGMKESTAVMVEQYLKDPTSPFYLGPSYEHKLDFTSPNVEQERFTRMTDQHDHYWSYLYAGLYMHELMQEWTAAGYPLEDRPEITSTLYNIGFTHSNPNAAPQVGGAAITVGGKTYSFGGLAAEFYNSDKLTDVFPIPASASPKTMPTATNQSAATTTVIQ